jgi:hypothetical protein
VDDQVRDLVGPGQPLQQRSCLVRREQVTEDLITRPAGLSADAITARNDIVTVLKPCSVNFWT